MKILALDPSPLMLRLIHDELVVGGHEVLMAEYCDQALDLLRTIPNISLITTSLVLDSGDGFSFIQGLRSDEVQSTLAPLRNDNLPAILVTANDTDADRLRGYNAGAADFIQKPWHHGHLLSRVEDVACHDDELAGMSVLVADDSPTARSFLRICLGRLGVTVHEVDDGDTALAFLRDHRVDMLVTDLNMVRMDGDELCRKVRGELGLTDLPVIFLSANEDEFTVLSLFKLGATDYLKKPFLQEELSVRLKVHLDRARLISTLRQVADIRSADQPGQPHAQRIAPYDGNDPQKRLQVLLVDDAPVNLAVGGKLLTSLGCDVEAVCEGAFSVTCFTERLADRPFDLVLMDLQMPNVNGFEATKLIRAVEAEHGHGPVHIVALSAVDPEMLREDCLAAGMDDVVAKPLEADLLRELMDRVTCQPT
jgi:CheY-like chemotaxis protein